jgi:hypothetical protein
VTKLHSNTGLFLNPLPINPLFARESNGTPQAVEELEIVTLAKLREVLSHREKPTK